MRCEDRAYNKLLLLKKQLPYLGDKEGFRQDNCQDYLTVRARRPNYDIFKSKVYNSEIACAEIIIGVCPLNEIFTFHNEICTKIIETPRDEVFILNNDPQFKYSSDICFLISNIRETIDLGIETNDIGKIVERPIHPLDKDDLFKTNRLFNSLSFLQWMKKNGFPVPTELDFCDNQNGNPNKGHVPLNQSIVSIKTPPKTTWGQIRVRYVNDDHVEIYHPGIKTHAPYSMADLGFDNKRMLAALFKSFADNKGGINGENMGIKAIKANVSNLRKHLKQVFPNVEGPPITNYHKTKGYVCNFIISKSEIS